MADRLVSPIAFKPIYYQLKALGTSKQQALRILQIAGIDKADINSTRPCIPAGRYYQAWQAAADITDDPLIGLHIGERMHPSSLGVLGYAIMNCRNILDALRLTIRVNPYQNETVRNDVRIEDDVVIIELNSWYSSEQVRPWVEMCLSAYLSLFHLVTNHQYKNQEKQRNYSYLEVGFKHAPAGPVEEYQRVFNSEVKFNQASNYARFEAHLGELPVFMADPDMLNNLMKELDIRHLPNMSSREAVRNYICRHMADGLPTQQKAATELGMSRSTLTRRLRDEGTSYGELCEQLRQQTALDLLKNTNNAAVDIAQQLGFSNASAFFRVFKQWQGETPGQYRKRFRPQE